MSAATIATRTTTRVLGQRVSVSVYRNQYHRHFAMLRVGRVGVGMIVRRATHLTCGVSWYADPNIRDFSIHLVAVSFSLKHFAGRR